MFSILCLSYVITSICGCSDMASNGEEIVREEEANIVREEGEYFDTEIPVVAPPRKKQARGCTTLPHVVRKRSSGVKTQIEFNSDYHPIGENRVEFQSYLGTLARTIPIDIDSWKNVSTEHKNRVWGTLLVSSYFSFI